MKGQGRGILAPSLGGSPIQKPEEQLTDKESGHLGRRAIEFDNHRVHSFLSKLCTEALYRKHPKVGSIIGDTLDQHLPRRLSGSTLLRVLQGCPVITTRAAAEATGHRYARSSIAEYAMLARVASRALGEYISAKALHVI